MNRVWQATPAQIFYLIGGFAIICGVIGTIPHFLLSFDFGLDTYFQGAWDESFYLLSIYGEIPQWNNYPLRQALTGLLNLSAMSKQSFLFWADVILPALAAIAAGILVSRVTRNPLIVIVFSCLIIYGGDIFSFNSSVYTFSGLSLTNLLQHTSLDMRKFFLDPISSFIAVYRTPEPQLSFTVFILYLAALINYLIKRDYSLPAVVAVVLTGLLCAIAYPFFSLSALGLGGAAVISLLISGNKKLALYLVLCLVLQGACALLVILMNYQHEARAMFFESRLPLLSLSAIYGLVIALAVIYLKRTAVYRDPLILFSIALLVFPIGIINQQLITGVMVQAVNWERYVNFCCVIVGVLIISNSQTWYSDKPTAAPIDEPPGRLKTFLAARNVQLTLTFVFIGLFLSVLIRAQTVNYKQYAAFNVKTYLYADAINKLLTANNALRNYDIVLDRMSLDASVHARSPMRGLNLKGYTYLVAELTDDDFETTKEKSKRGFFVASRLGLNVDEYMKALEIEIGQRACWPHLMFQFEFLKCAPYVSDFREYAPNELREQIVDIAKQYNSYLSESARQSDLPAIVLSEAPLDLSDASSLQQLKLIGEFEISSKAPPVVLAYKTKVHAYLSSP